MKERKEKNNCSFIRTDGKDSCNEFSHLREDEIRSYDRLSSVTLSSIYPVLELLCNVFRADREKRRMLNTN